MIMDFRKGLTRLSSTLLSLLDEIVEERLSAEAPLTLAEGQCALLEVLKCGTLMSALLRESGVCSLIC